MSAASVQPVEMTSPEGASQPRPRQCVSVIIVSYWTGPLLVRSVLSALRQAEVAEVIVVDNGNWVDEMTRLEAIAGDNSHKLQIISGHGNVGYAAGCNIGAKAATGQFLFLLNPDAILPDNAVAELLADAGKLDGKWVMGGKLINPDGTEQAGSRRSPLTPWTAFVEMTRIYKLAPQHPYFRRFNMHQDPCPEEMIPIPVISGACMLMPRETFSAIDGMDEEYFLHVEDVDFCLRLRDAGGEVYFSPSTSIPHFKSSSRASKLRVEMRKAQSLVRYFWTHFRKPYPAVFLALVSALVWAATGVKALNILIRRGLRLVGLRKKTGKEGVRKARSITSQSSSR
ncbi:glycosyltransferase family 2 protein [Parvularcula sp. IMCC14364]|uniref:glycosyltransferase family 2 protein n=1 Tax=Parvularcula sp. IMCC14364 TaxID=3067902 RepID=UPI0027422CBB|nr:glycosyltransferase family 2 protein [Parvularcula sp. IMCC14364]